MKNYQYFMPTRVIQAPGCVNTLREQCAALGEKPLLVTGKHSARKSGLLDRVLKQFPNAVVFDAVEENPSTENCEAGGVLCRESHCDFIIALGGGSPIDAAKAIAILATNEGPCAQYFGSDQYSRPPLPLVAVPTTAGTGSEVTPYAVLVDSAQKAKRTVKGAALFPRIALLDPELSVTMPASVTAATGMDALSQAMEGLLSKANSPTADVLALEACRLLRTWLPFAVAEPENLEARAAMLHGAMLSGIVIAHSGTTLVHGMGYYFTLHFGLAHGLANALLLGPIFAWNAYEKPQKIALLCEALGLPASGEAAILAETIHQGVAELMQTCRLSNAAKDYGVRRESLAEFSRDISTDPYRFKNQVGSLSADQVQILFEAAWAGCPPDFSR